MDTREGGLKHGPNGDPAPAEPKSSSEIRHDIQRTRGELDATVRALEEKLRPERVLWQARQKVEPEVRAVTQKALLFYRQNRPAVLGAAAGLLGLFLLRGVRSRRRGRYFPKEQRGL